MKHNEARSLMATRVRVKAEVRHWLVAPETLRAKRGTYLARLHLPNLHSTEHISQRKVSAHSVSLYLRMIANPRPGIFASDNCLETIAFSYSLSISRSCSEAARAIRL